MKKKFVYIFSALAILLLCFIIVINIVDYYDKKSRIDNRYNLAKSVPRTDACEVIYRYTLLLELENLYETNFYTDEAKNVIETYQPRCGFRYRDIQTFKRNYYGLGKYDERESLFLECDNQTSVVTEKEIIKNTDPQITLSDVFERIMPEDSELLKNRPNWKFFIHLSKSVGKDDFQDYQYIFVREEDEPIVSGLLLDIRSGILNTEDPTKYKLKTRFSFGEDFEINRETLSLSTYFRGSYPIKFRGTNYQREVSMKLSTKCTIDSEADENWLIKIKEISDGIMEEKRLKDLEEKKEQLKQELEERLKREKEVKEQKEKNII